MFRLPSGLYFSAYLGSLFVSILCTCCSHFFWYLLPEVNIVNYFYGYYNILEFEYQICRIREHDF